MGRPTNDRPDRGRWIGWGLPLVLLLSVMGKLTLERSAWADAEGGPEAARPVDAEARADRSAAAAAAAAAAAPAPEAPSHPAASQPPPPREVSEEQLNERAGALRTRLMGRGFVVQVQRPFVVIGNEPEAMVRARCVQTVGWAVTRLKRQYFPLDPDHVIEVWLFRDDASYRAGAKEFLGDEPTTPFGYYSPSGRALVMNISTGGGTLVHELVHPFMRANFPACPAWLNEGLGSLYEQSAERDGKIVGLTNWRLAGLQKAIEQRATIGFPKLLSLTDAEFYGRAQGLHYAQARYLCYYLQERGLLEVFYGRYRAAHREASDRTGERTLAAVLSEAKLLRLAEDGSADWAAFAAGWEKWVAGLTFP